MEGRPAFHWRSSRKSFASGSMLTRRPLFRPNQCRVTQSVCWGVASEQSTAMPVFLQHFNCGRNVLIRAARLFQRRTACVLQRHSARVLHHHSPRTFQPYSTRVFQQCATSRQYVCGFRSMSTSSHMTGMGSYCKWEWTILKELGLLGHDNEREAGVCKNGEDV